MGQSAEETNWQFSVAVDQGRRRSKSALLRLYTSLSTISVLWSVARIMNSPIYFKSYPFTSKARRVLQIQQNTKLEVIEFLEMYEESSLEEGEIRNSSSSSLEQSDATPCQDLGPGTTSCLIQEEMISNLVQSDATPCQDFVPGTTGCLIQEEMISNLVQFLQAGPCRHIIWGIIKGILEELGKFNIDNLDAFFKSSEYIGTTTIQTFGGDTSHWTTFCATLANNIHELTSMCRPITCDSSLHEKTVEWEAEFEKLKKLEQKESYIRHQVMKLRINRDHLILELYKKTAITIERNGGVVQEIRQQEAALEGMVKELKEVACLRKEVSDQCDRLRQLVVQSDSDRLQREINAHAIYRHVCFTVKSLMEKLEEPTLSLSTGI